ncbi:GGDEF domain-containing phosphodiesterase [Roseburia hominis]
MRGKRECVWNPEALQDDRQQDIADIISHNFLKILKVNLTTDTHLDVLVAADELEGENGYADRFSEWLERFAGTGYVSEEDRNNYLSFCNLNHLRKRFKTGSKFISCHYRRKVDGEFRWVSMEVVAGKEYRDDNQVVFLYVRDIHSDYLQQLNFTVQKTENALSVINLNLTGNMYGAGCGDYVNLVMNRTNGTTDDYLNYLSSFIQGEKEKQEFQEIFNRENLIRLFERGETLVTFLATFMLKEETRRTLKFTVAMEQNSFSGDVEAVLYTMDVTREYLRSHLIPMLYRTNFQTIGVIDLKRGTIALNKGELKDISQLIDSEESYEEVRRKVSIEYIAPVDREGYLLKTTTENLKKNLAENDYYAFPIYYEEDGEKRIKNYRYRYLSKEFELVIATVEDVTTLAEKDALTGGLNQQGFIRNVELLMERQELKDKYAILCLDVKGFKAINELFGILEGNDLLRALYRSLEKSFLEPEIVARVEADQYLCLVEWGKLDFEKLVSWCEKDFCIKGKPFRVSKRCGIYLIREHTMAVRSMCDRARLALSIAKSERSIKPYIIFDDMMNAEYVDRSEILGQFDNSLKNREFCIYLQPVMDPVSGQISAAEALVRWKHPEKGFISPQHFIPALEGNGYISQLDLYVVHEVERFQQQRAEQGLPVVPISVNLSWMDFYDEELVSWLHNYAESQKDQKHRIYFEITETSYAAVAENKSQLLEQIREYGVAFSLDDFGSGYSSFSTLQNYDFDILKIDIGFVRRIEQCDKTKSIIDSIIKMVHQMDAKVVAEGAETLEQVEFLKERGCDYVQGYYYYKPMPMEIFAELLNQQMA